MYYVVPGPAWVGVKHKVPNAPNHRLNPAGRFISTYPRPEGSKIVVQRNIVGRNGGCCCEMRDGPGQTGEQLTD